MPSVTTIIVNYNAGAWLPRAVGSALDYANGDVYVVDNNSSDDSVIKTQQSLADNPRLHWVLNKQNIGFAAANNQVLAQVLAKTESDYAVLLNPDCEINAQTLNLIIEQLENNPTVGLASCRINNEDGSLQTTSRRKFPTPWTALVRLLMLDKLFPSNPKFANFDYGQADLPESDIEFIEAISGAFMVARVSAVKQVGLLDEGYFMHCEDLDWCKRFQLNDWKVGFVPTASVLHAKGVSSQSRPLAVLWTLHVGMQRFFDKFYRQETAWPVRWLVKLGIYTSFVLRACKSILLRFIKS